MEVMVVAVTTLLMVAVLGLGAVLLSRAELLVLLPTVPSGGNALVV